MRRGFERLWTGPLASVVAVSGLAVLLMAAPAGARIFTLHGHSTGNGCNGDARVVFYVKFSNGNYDVVGNFRARDFGYPNFTPPVPAGKPRGQCIPGEVGDDDPADLWVDWPTGYVVHVGQRDYALPFGGRGLDENEFYRSWKDREPGASWIFAQRTVSGEVNVKRVGRPHHRHFEVSAHGWFLKAQSESGLKFGGPSTGIVNWKASFP